MWRPLLMLDFATLKRPRLVVFQSVRFWQMWILRSEAAIIGLGSLIAALAGAPAVG